MLKAPRFILPGKVVIISTCVMVLGMVITMVGFFVDRNPSAHLAVAITGCVPVAWDGRLI